LFLLYQPAKPGTGLGGESKAISMEPLLHDDYIIVVDRAHRDRDKLKDKVIVAFCQRYGLMVSRDM
jgi:hypothetical protein